MIRSLRAANFKSWKDTGEVRLGRLTGFFGANSSGKTSLLQLLLLLKQTTESTDRRRVLNTGDETTPVDVGTYHDFIYRHNRNASLQIWLDWDTPAPFTVHNPEGEGDLFRVEHLEFHTEIREILANGHSRPLVTRFEYRTGHQCFGMERMPARHGEDTQYQLISGHYPARRIRGRAWPLPEPVKCYGFPDEAIGYFQNTGFLPVFPFALETAFSNVAYLGPLRTVPRRSYVWAGDRPADVGRDGRDAVAALLASRDAGKSIRRGKGKRRQSVEECVAERLQRMKLIHSFSVREIASNRRDYEVRVKKSSDSPEVLITDVGFGVSQILPVLVLCYYVPEGSTIILEQPEIHLHPSVQADLADVLVDVIRYRNVQVIVESHSEHLLRRIQRRIAEDQMDASDTSLYFCSMKEGDSHIAELRIDEFGNIANWPTEFFGDETGDLIAMTEAAMQRQMTTRRTRNSA